MSRYPINKKLVAIGDGACGKTSLLIRFQKGEFPEEYVPTIFENYAADLEIGKNQLIRLALFDTAGQEDYDRLRPIAYNDTDIILICFDISNRDSLVNVEEKWVTEAEFYMKNVPILLVGCKSDLRKPNAGIESSQGLAMALRVRAAEYCECSAKTGENVERVFRVAAELTMRKKRSKCCELL